MPERKPAFVMAAAKAVSEYQGCPQACCIFSDRKKLGCTKSKFTEGNEIQPKEAEDELEQDGVWPETSVSVAIDHPLLHVA